MNENQAQVNRTEKKPYEKPQVVYRERLEAMATSCTPNGKTGVDANCITSGVINS